MLLLILSALGIAVAIKNSKPVDPSGDRSMSTAPGSGSGQLQTGTSQESMLPMGINPQAEVNIFHPIDNSHPNAFVYPPLLQARQAQPNERTMIASARYREPMF